MWIEARGEGGGEWYKPLRASTHNLSIENSGVLNEEIHTATRKEKKEWYILWVWCLKLMIVIVITFLILNYLHASRMLSKKKNESMEFLFAHHLNVSISFLSEVFKSVWDRMPNAIWDGFWNISYICCGALTIHEGI